VKETPNNERGAESNGGDAHLFRRVDLASRHVAVWSPVERTTTGVNEKIQGARNVIEPPFHPQENSADAFD